MNWRPPQGALAELLRGARQDLDRRRRIRPHLIQEMQRSGTQAFRGTFKTALADGTRSGFPLICEVKRASPSAGQIRASLDPAMLAKAYEEGGARCISVLTEGRKFQGSLEDLARVRATVGVPLLRKDFIVDPYMVYEALAYGASCVLVIAGALPPSELQELWACANEIGLDVLFEVAAERELELVSLAPWSLVGINARDLETLEVDPSRFARLSPRLRQPGRLLVAESGIRSPSDILAVKEAGAAAALVGESLVRAEGPAEAVRALAGAS